MAVPGLPEIEQARARLSGIARVTPVYGSETLSRLAGRPVHLKTENLQRTGSFKIRGAVNKLATLGDVERAAGVVAASAGNHAQAVAWAAREVGVKATIFVPQDAPMAKVEATRSYGAEVEMGGEGLEEAVTAAQKRVAATGATFVHPYEDEVIVAGQGTIGLELAEQVPDVETVLVPIGGGGLAAGIGLALRAARPGVRIVGVRAATDAFAIADGIAVKQPGELTGPILDEVLDDVVEVAGEDIAQAIVLLLERTKLVVEGAGAVGIAALLEGKVPGDGPVAVVLSGGNIDASTLITVMRYGVTLAGRHLVVRTHVPDRPGELLKLLQLVAEARVNVLSVEHRREGVDIPVGATGIDLTLLARDEEHSGAIVREMQGWGYEVERLR
jgi:threonine dehydratase